MLVEFFKEVEEAWTWLTTQLGFSDITWFHILFIALAFLGILSVLRRLVGSGSSAVRFPTGTGGNPGLSPKFYMGSSKLSDFSVPQEVYRFGVPTPKVDTSGLTEPLKLDLDLAQKLFAPKLMDPFELNWDLAKKLFTPSYYRSEEVEDSSEEDN